MAKFWQVFLFIIAISLYSLAISANDYELGKKLFNDPLLGGGTTGKTCHTCHADGEGIDPDFADKASYMVMGLEIHTLPEVINNCIEITLRGEDLDPESSEMKALIAYIKVLKNSIGP